MKSFPKANIFYASFRNTCEEWADKHGEYRLSAVNQVDMLLTIETVGGFEETGYVVSAGLVSIGSTDEVPNSDQAAHAENSIFLNGISSIQESVSINSTQPGVVDFNNWPSKLTGNLFIGPRGVPKEIVPKHTVWHPASFEVDIYVMEKELEIERLGFSPFPDFNLIAPSFIQKDMHIWFVRGNRIQTCLNWESQETVSGSLR